MSPEEPVTATFTALWCPVGLDLTIRRATRSDDGALAGLDRAAADPGTYVTPPKATGEFFAGSTSPGDVLVAEEDGQVVGYVKIRPPTPLESNAHVQQIQGLGVHPAARRRGVASALLDAALVEAGRRGAAKLSLRVLASNPGALALYRAHGYEVEGVLRAEFRIDDGTYTDDIVMARSLR